MSPPAKTIWLVALGSLGLGLLLLRVDREFINLTPTEGAAHAVRLDSGHTYTQVIQATKTPISRLGLYLTGAKSAPHLSIPLTITLPNGENVTSALPAIFFEKEKPVLVVFNPPLRIDTPAPLTLSLTIPQEISGAVHIQTRAVDESFLRDIPVFAIDGHIQPNPMAYQVFYDYKPPFAVQLGLVALIIAFLLARHKFPISYYAAFGYSLALAFVYAVPLWLQGSFSPLLFLTQTAALFGMILWLRQSKLPPAPVLFGAHAFALTTWFPLHILSGREAYALIAFIPLIIAIAKLNLLKRNWLGIALALLVIISLLIANNRLYSSTAVTNDPASLRNILFDPNQVPHSQKIPGGLTGWDNYGSYLGLLVSAAALIGLFFRGEKTFYLIVMAAFFFIVAASPLTSLIAPILPFPPQHLIIGLTGIMAIYAALGLDTLYNFLGKQTALANICIWGVVLYALLDLINIGIPVLEFSYL